ncbi:hypothetical protein I6A84_01075 [Frankia sp. CNm7]|uniref:Uncharacterized protein n=1 Tax=Frankia nepalensis TaxID=1836974 RepID=A0A937RLP9_9ACTN|nr:hypothetical protein [Frankia nepalensis]MBL7496151.1 hypothetical protein [Frankia nepalensis]MBL7508910.1 hypothetical protein [Frankia nepalensis]MBL7516750.1 hypothetical protein [Frankia nepalensis]MBL7628688.1 hypothetical protein [Frankia nepalensis]
MRRFIGITGSDYVCGSLRIKLSNWGTAPSPAGWLKVTLVWESDGVGLVSEGLEEVTVSLPPVAGGGTTVFDTRVCMTNIIEGVGPGGAHIGIYGTRGSSYFAPTSMVGNIDSSGTTSS